MDDKRTDDLASLDLSIDDILSEIKFIFILHGICLALVITVGVVCNILSLYILCRPHLRSPPYCLLQVLTVCDTAILFYSLYSDVQPSISAYKQSLQFSSIAKLDFSHFIIGNDTGNNTITENQNLYLLLKTLMETEVTSSFGNETHHDYDVFLNVSQFPYSKTTGVSHPTEQPRTNSTSVVINSRPIGQAVERFIGYLLLSIGLLLTLALAIERCVAVVLPLKVTSVVTVRRTRIAVVGIVMTSVLFHLPQLIKEVLMSTTMKTLADDFEGNVLQSFRKDYERAFVFFTSIVGLVVLALNMFLLHKITVLRRKGKLSRNTSERRSYKSQINITVLITGITLLQIPVFLFMNIFSFMTMENFLTQFQVVAKVTVILRFLYVSNSAFNVFMYCAFSQQFRKTLANTFRSYFGQSKSYMTGSKYHSPHTTLVSTPRVTRVTIDNRHAISV